MSRNVSYIILIASAYDQVYHSFVTLFQVIILRLFVLFCFVLFCFVLFCLFVCVVAKPIFDETICNSCSEFQVPSFRPLLNVAISRPDMSKH